jgi:hypothetical protein
MLSLANYTLIIVAIALLFTLSPFIVLVFKAIAMISQLKT